MADTKIEWATKVWNPVTGCTKVSAGCKNCYAEREWARISHNPKLAKYVGRAFTDVRFHRESFLDPLAWKKPERVFVNSMSDLFHDAISDEVLHQIFDVMLDCPRHTFLVLTKRAERMRDFCIERERLCADLRNQPSDGDVDPSEFVYPMANVWLGVSVEDQKSADERIPLLLQTPAAVRWISAEPLLGPVNLTQYLRCCCVCDVTAPEGDCPHSYRNHEDSRTRLDWVVCGGESGPQARPMHPDWARALRDQCQAAGVPFFFKQWGEWTSREIDSEREIAHLCCIDLAGQDCALSHKAGEEWWFLPAYPGSRGTWAPDGIPPGVVETTRVGKKRAGRLLDGREWNEYPPAQ